MCWLMKSLEMTRTRLTSSSLSAGEAPADVAGAFYDQPAGPLIERRLHRLQHQEAPVPACPGSVVREQWHRLDSQGSDRQQVRRPPRSGAEPDQGLGHP